MLVLLFAAALGIHQSSAAGTFDEPGAHFRSAGVRGTIDSGGYAASAAVKTQTQFYGQLTLLQTAGLQHLWASCAHSEVWRSAVRLVAQSDYAGAVKLLESTGGTPTEPDLHQLLGLAYEGTGQLEAAAEQFREAAAAQPNEAAFFAQGVALLFAGEVTRAESAFRQTGTKAGEPGSLTHLGLGAVLFERGQVQQALGLFLDAAVAKPDEAAAFLFLALALRSAGPAESARCIEVLTSLSHKRPNNGNVHYGLACALASHDAQPDEIIDQLRQATALAPRIADAHFRLAESYAVRQSLELAISEYRAALDCDPSIVEAHYRLGELYARSGQQSLAKEQFELHRQARSQQKSEIERGRVPIRLRDTTGDSLLGLCQGK